MNKVPVSDYEHIRRVVALCLRKFRRDDNYSPKSNTMLLSERQRRQYTAELVVSYCGVTKEQAENLVNNFYGEKEPDHEVSYLKQKKVIDLLAPYCDGYMGLGTKEEALDKFLNLYSVNTDYGMPDYKNE